MSMSEEVGGDAVVGTVTVAAAPPRRVLPKRIVTIPLAAPYDEFTVTAWVNYPNSLRADINSGDLARIEAAFLQIVLDHDLVDHDGEPYPPANTSAFWDALPVELGRVIYEAVEGQQGRLSPPKAGR